MAPIDVVKYQTSFNIYIPETKEVSLLVTTLEFRIDGSPRLLIIPFFATPTNLI